jgi:tRNA modification GTPase
LIGRPNVGKSSILNRLAGDDVAIVTPIAGTTRDHVRATIYLEGVPIHLIDTAGLRATDDEVEKIGIARTWEAIKNAGAALLITEAVGGANAEDRAIVDQLPRQLPLATVYNKIDLILNDGVSRETIAPPPVNRGLLLRVSALRGDGLDDLRQWLLTTAGWQAGSEGVFMARERHLRALSEATTNIAAAAALNGQFEILAEELRLAQSALSRITGEFTPDDLLGEIFGKFCIGK